VENEQTPTGGNL